MASAVPYDPDDFENNNPFAEPAPVILDIPHDEQNSESFSQNSPVLHQAPLHTQEPSPTSAPEYVSDTANADNATSNTSTSETQESPDSYRLSDEELRKLIPERFTSKYRITITLKTIEKNKPGNPILNFDATVEGLANFRHKSYKEIRRTYAEVSRFNKYLTVSNLEVCVPVLPLAVTSYPSGGVDENKQLLAVWQEWFNRITTNPILIRDEEFVFFIESDFGYQVINSHNKTSIASGLLRKTLKQFQVPYDPYQELAEFRPVIKASYLECQKLHKTLEKKSRAEKQLLVHFSDLAQRLQQMSEFEIVHPGMKNMWEKMLKVTAIQADLQLIELVNDMGSFGDGVLTLLEDFYQIKEALTNRHLVMRELITAEKDTRTKHAVATRIKNKSLLDPLKVDEAIRALEYASKTEESLNLQLKRISGEMLYERKEIVDHTDAKLKLMLQSFTLHKVEHHRRILKYLENIRLDVRIVDERGGLSRLNRENLLSLKHNLPQSQMAQGDAWTQRTFRSLSTKETTGKEEEDIDVKHAASLLGVATF